MSGMPAVDSNKSLVQRWNDGRQVMREMSREFANEYAERRRRDSSYGHKPILDKEVNVLFRFETVSVVCLCVVYSLQG
jgi:hypothetical protein